MWEHHTGDYALLSLAGDLGTARIAYLVATDTTAERCLMHFAEATRTSPSTDHTTKAGPGKQCLPGPAFRGSGDRI
ncbi:hypothetical protein KNE206_53110 [Kitasatospora sp. NE20-6]